MYLYVGTNRCVSVCGKYVYLSIKHCESVCQSQECGVRGVSVCGSVCVRVCMSVSRCGSAPLQLGWAQAL